MPDPISPDDAPPQTPHPAPAAARICAFFRRTLLLTGWGLFLIALFLPGHRSPAHAWRPTDRIVPTWAALIGSMSRLVSAIEYHPSHHRPQLAEWSVVGAGALLSTLAFLSSPLLARPRSKGRFLRPLLTGSLPLIWAAPLAEALNADPRRYLLTGYYLLATAYTLVFLSLVRSPRNP